MIKNKKVLFIHHGSVAGGAPLSMLYTMQGMQEKGIKPIVGLLKPSNELHHLYNSNGFKTFEMPWIPIFITWSASEGKRWNPIMWKGVYNAWSKWENAKKKLHQFILEHKVDMVHLNSVGLSCAASCLQENNIPYIWHVREHGPKHKGRRYKFLQNKLKKAKSVIFLSKAEQQSWLEGYEHGVIVHNFIDFKKFDVNIDTENSRKQLKIKNKEKVLLYVGGAKKHKGIFTLLEALEIVKNKYNKHFICLMPDTFVEADKKPNRVQSEILSFIKKYSLENVCKLLPFNPNIVDLFALSDILLFPATKPHFARPIIEASAMRTPVIASKLKAIDELVINGETGFLVKADSPKAIADKIITLFNDEELCLKFGEKGYRFAKENFEFSSQIDKIHQVYLNT